MSSITSSQKILHLRSIFARHGYPDKIVTDNGTKVSSCEFSDFAKTINMKHTTSSLLFPQSNGLAERSVKMVKSLLFSSTDPYEALLAYRSTPLKNGYSPAQLLYSRQLRTNVPITLQQRHPTLPDSSRLAQVDQHLKQRQKKNFDSRHRIRPIHPLPLNSTVFIPDSQETGQVVSQPVHRSCQHLPATSGEIDVI